MEQAGTLKKSIEGGRWTLINTVSRSLINFFTFLLLARLLAPGDFGILTILLIVPNFIILISATGFEAALIQKKDDPIPYLNSIWTFNILKSLASFAVIFFAAPFIASFFRIPEALLAVRLSGLIVLISGSANVAQLFFFKNIDFKSVFIRDMAGSIAYSAVALTLSVFYRSFWSLFWGTIALHLASTFSIYFLHEFRPRLDFRFGKLLPLTNYGKWIYGQNMMDRFAPTIENSLIARITGATEVGLYTRAKSLAGIINSPFYNIIDRVAFPTYSRIQDSYAKIADGFLKSLDVLFFVSVPVALLFMGAGHRIVLILLGTKWLEIGSLLTIISLAFAVDAFSTSAMPVFNAVNKPGIKFWIQLVNLTSLSAFLFILIPGYGIRGAAMAILATSAIVSLLAVIVLKKIVAVRFREIVKAPLIPLLASLAVLAAEQSISNYLEPMTDIGFISLISLLGALYCALIVLAGRVFRIGPYPTLRLIASETLNFKRAEN